MISRIQVDPTAGTSSSSATLLTTVRSTGTAPWGQSFYLFLQVSHLLSRADLVQRRRSMTEKSFIMEEGQAARDDDDTAVVTPLQDEEDDHPGFCLYPMAWSVIAAIRQCIRCGGMCSKISDAVVVGPDLAKRLVMTDKELTNVKKRRGIARSCFPPTGDETKTLRDLLFDKKQQQVGGGGGDGGDGTAAAAAEEGPKTKEGQEEGSVADKGCAVEGSSDGPSPKTEKEDRAVTAVEQGTTSKKKNEGVTNGEDEGEDPPMIREDTAPPPPPNEEPSAASAPTTTATALASASPTNVPDLQPPLRQVEAPVVAQLKLDLGGQAKKKNPKKGGKGAAATKMSLFSASVLKYEDHHAGMWQEEEATTTRDPIQPASSSPAPSNNTRDSHVDPCVTSRDEQAVVGNGDVEATAANALPNEETTPPLSNCSVSPQTTSPASTSPSTTPRSKILSAKSLTFSKKTPQALLPQPLCADCRQKVYSLPKDRSEVYYATTMQGGTSSGGTKSNMSNLFTVTDRVPASWYASVDILAEELRPNLKWHRGREFELMLALSAHVKRNDTRLWLSKYFKRCLQQEATDRKNGAFAPGGPVVRESLLRIFLDFCCALANPELDGRFTASDEEVLYETSKVLHQAVRQTSFSLNEVPYGLVAKTVVAVCDLILNNKDDDIDWGRVVDEFFSAISVVTTPRNGKVKEALYRKDVAQRLRAVAKLMKLPAGVNIRGVYANLANQDDPPKVRMNYFYQQLLFYGQL